MNKLIVVLMVFGFAAAAFADATVKLTADNGEIVIAKDAVPVVRFAAEEARTLLGQAFGRELPVVNAPTPGKASLVLGMNE